MRLGIPVAALALLVATATGCGSAAAPASAEPSLAGNGVVAALPSDAPSAVLGRAAVFDCGAEQLFEADVDVTPIPTPPRPTTAASANQQGLTCLIDAWQGTHPAQFVTHEVSDEGDDIYTLYRIVGDGTLLMDVRLWSHADRTVTWTESTCTELSVDSGRVIPATCTSEVQIH